MTTTFSRPAGYRRMSLWRLEWLRLVRTPRAISLAVLFVAIGLIEPVVTKYERTIFAHVGNGVRISAPPPTAADGLNAYVSEVLLIGLILVVVLAAGALTFDASQGRAIFLRTRVAGTWRLIAPRVAVTAAADAVAYLLGTLAAWYETRLLLGSLPATRVLAGVFCGAVYLAFAVAVTALAASLARSTIATSGIALMILLILPVLGSVRVVARWLPSALVNAPVGLVSGTHQIGYYFPALVIAAAASAAALAVATRRLNAREV
ncbi:MAG TPA: ABC transporter [Streptosporangiaceae bacterium]|jgi:ABC-2 type transport system permease protein